MTDPVSVLLDFVQAHLFDGVFATDQAIVLQNAKLLEERLLGFLRKNLDHAAVTPFRSKTRKGLGAIDRKSIQSLLPAWKARLSAFLEERTRKGEVVAGLLPGARNVQTCFLLAPRAADRFDLVSETRALVEWAEGLERRIERIKEIARRLEAVNVPAEKTTIGAVETPPAGSMDLRDSDRAAFRHAYEQLNSKGWGFVPIHQMRATLGWSKDRFDAAVATLRAELAVELQVGNPADYQEVEIESSYAEPDGTLFLTMSWRGS